MFNVGYRVANEPEGMQYFGDRKANDNGFTGNDQAKTDRVVVDIAGPAAA